MCRRAIALVAMSFLAGGCAGDANLTDSGKGRPIVTGDFPATSESGSIQDLEITIENPGPGDIRTVVVAFALVGPVAGQDELPEPLVAIGVKGRSPSVVTIEPSPRGVSDDAALYTFEGLDEGETATYTFEVKVPEQPGTAANSVQVYDGQEVERAAGVRVETTVER